MQRQPMTTADQALDVAQDIATRIDPDDDQQQQLSWFHVTPTRACGGVYISYRSLLRGNAVRRLLCDIVAEEITELYGYEARTSFGVIAKLNERSGSARERVFYLLLTKRVIPTLLAMQQMERLSDESLNRQLSALVARS